MHRKLTEFDGKTGGCLESQRNLTDGLADAQKVDES